MSNSFFERALVSSFGKTPAQHGLRPEVAVRLFFQSKDKHVICRTTVLRDAGVDGEPTFCHTLHSHDLPCNEDSDEVFVGSPRIPAKFRGFLSPYSFVSRKNVPKTLDEMYTRGCYAWDTRAMQVVGSADSITGIPAPPLTLATSELAKRETERSSKFLLDSVDEDLHRK